MLLHAWLNRQVHPHPAMRRHHPPAPAAATPRPALARSVAARPASAAAPTCHTAPPLEAACSTHCVGGRKWRGARGRRVLGLFGCSRVHFPLPPVMTPAWAELERICCRPTNINPLTLTCALRSDVVPSTATPTNHNTPTDTRLCT